MQNAGYAMIAQRYGAEFGYDPRAIAKIAVDQRTNVLANPDAIFHDQPITIDDVLDSRMIADPLHLLEIVMPCVGGGVFVVAGREHARRAGIVMPSSPGSASTSRTRRTPTCPT